MLGFFLVFIGLGLLVIFVVAAAKNSSSRGRRGKSRNYSGYGGSYSSLYSGDAGAYNSTSHDTSSSDSGSGGADSSSSCDSGSGGADSSSSNF